MAKIDFINYYNQCCDDYNAMLTNVKELQKCFKDNLITEERFNEAKHEIDIVKNNYETLSYIMMLLKIPTKKDKREKFNKDNNYIFDYLISVDKNEVHKKNKAAIENLKRMAKEYQNDNK